MFKPKPVFAAWKEDTTESLRIAMELDLKNIAIFEFVGSDKQDANRLVQHLSDNYAGIKEIYTYLQGKSNQYPNIDFVTMRDDFIKKLEID